MPLPLQRRDVRSTHLLPIALAAATLPGSLHGQCTSQWVETYGGGRTPSIRALLVHDDGHGEGPELYAGSQLGYVVRWDGVRWHSVGTNFNGPVRALATYNGRLFAGGLFTERIVRLDGNQWTVLTSPPVGTMITALTEYEGELIAAGSDGSGGRVDAWNGQQWRQLGSSFNATVLSLIVHDGQLICGGHFLGSGGAPSRVARWNGQTWVAIGGPVPGILGVGYGFVAFDDYLLAAGLNLLTGVDGVPAWNGVNWASVFGPVGFSSAPQAMAVHDGNLVVGGQFNSLVSLALPAEGLAIWNGQQWFGIVPGIRGWEPAAAFATFEDQLVIGGSLVVAGGHQTAGVAVWDGTSVRPIIRAFNGPVQAFAEYLGDVIAVGAFTTFDGRDVDRVARFAGHDGWFPLGTIPFGSGQPEAAAADSQRLAVSVHDLSTARSEVAMWNGEQWQLLPSMDGNAWAMTFHDGQLIVAGTFLNAGGTAASRIARWNGQAWEPLGAGLSDQVNALAIHNGDLIAGGSFTEAGGQPANRIARWDGSTWSQFDQGLTYSVFRLASSGNRLYASTSGPRVLLWNGTQWNTLGTANLAIGALLPVDEDLYIGGTFQQLNGLPIGRIARWDGAQWHNLDPYPGSQGFPNYVNALAMHNGTLFAGGDMAGSPWLRYGAIPPEILTSPRNVNDPVDQCAFSIHAAGTDPISFQWRRNGTPLTDGPTSSGSTISGATTRRLVVSIPSSADAGQYDVVVANPCGQATSQTATLTIMRDCYANCDHSTTPPILNVDDFTCFINEFAGAQSLSHEQQIEHYANCDNSTTAPVLNIDDFTCFINAFAQGCP